MIILIGGKKGGSGKSTITMNLASELARQKKDVMIVDTDRQSSTAEWATERIRNQSTLPEIFCVQKYNEIHTTLLDLNKRYEYVLVDTAGRDAPELRSAMIVANKLLIPIRPSQLDLNTIPDMQKIINESKLVNPNLLTLAVLSMAPTNPIVNEAKEAQEFLAEFPSITLLKTIVRDRKIYRDVVSEGLGVVEIDKTSESARKAKKEIQDLAKEIFNGN
jgi:chromosome partitioning protein